MTILSEEFKPELIDRASSILAACEAEELRIAYSSECQSERGRIETGSYYTPADVSLFFWKHYFAARGFSSPDDVGGFIQRHAFIEPAVGAGALVFALLHQCVVSGVSPEIIRRIDLRVFDVNDEALDFVAQQLRKFGSVLGGTLSRIKFHPEDFLNASVGKGEKSIVVFGNPPFVRNASGQSRWKNRYADFLEKALGLAGDKGSVHFIVPMSLAFSRDYEGLRHLITQKFKTVAVSHFDNIPDTLFKSGKPKNQNSNKANSQRCSIFSGFQGDNPSLLTTRLHRWRRQERSRILGSPPEFVDASEFVLNTQFPRVESPRLLSYLRNADGAERLRDFCSKDGNYSVYVSGVARNYIGFRESIGAGVSEFRFKTKKEAVFFLAVCASDLFFTYWLTLGDGFHVTKSTILDFPVSEKIKRVVRREMKKNMRVWERRATYRKSKLNSGQKLSSFDFSGRFPSLLRHV